MPARLPGYFMNSTRNCQACLRWAVCEGGENASQTFCPAGQQGNQEQKCEYCPAGKAGGGRSECVRCTAPAEPNDLNSACECPERYYNTSNATWLICVDGPHGLRTITPLPAKPVCQQCPSCATCAGNSIPQVKPGFATESADIELHSDDIRVAFQCDLRRRDTRTMARMPGRHRSTGTK